MGSFPVANRLQLICDWMETFNCGVANDIVKHPILPDQIPLEMDSILKESFENYSLFKKKHG